MMGQDDLRIDEDKQLSAIIKIAKQHWTMK